MANTKNFRLRNFYCSDRAWNAIADLARRRKARLGEQSIGVGSEHISCSELVRQMLDKFLEEHQK
jgi:hypothetical protein